MASSEVVKFSPDYADVDRFEGVTITKAIIKGQRSISLTAGDKFLGTFSAHSAYLLALALFGISEDWKEPPSSEEIAALNLRPEPGDLVHSPQHQGEYDGFCLVWSDDHANGPNRRDDECWMAFRPGGGIIRVPISTLTIMQKSYRPREWFRAR